MGGWRRESGLPGRRRTPLSTLQAELHPLQPGDPAVLGGYRLLGRLGEGGQGRVYLGADRVGGRVAIKALHAGPRSGRQARRRLAAEADAARRVLPCFTARLVEFRTAGSTPYLVTAFIDGPSLHRQVRQQGPLRRAELEELAATTLTALLSIHDAGLVHHDVKPGNVLLGPDGPRLVDFGCCAPTGVPCPGARSRTGVLTTLAFMAPELLVPGTVTPAADLFSWAATMTFAGTGRTPFDGPDQPAPQPELLHRIERAEPDLSGMPDSLRPALLACLAKRPADRPTAAGALDRLLLDLGLADRSLPLPA